MSDFKDSSGNRKGDIVEEVNEVIAKLINERGFTSIQDIENIFNERSMGEFVFKLDLIEEVTPLFKGRSFNLETQNLVFENARKDFTSKFNYDRLVRKIDGQLKLVKDFSSWVYVVSDQILKFSDLPSFVTFEVFGGKKVHLSRDSSYEFDVGLMLLTDENGNLGIIRGDQFKHGLPLGIESGDVRNGRDYSGLWLTNEQGFVLLSPVDIFDNKLRTDEEMAALIKKTFNEYQMKIHYGYKKADIIKGFRGDYYRSSSHLAGNGIRSVLQRVVPTLMPTGTHEDILAGDVFKRTVAPKKPYKLNTRRMSDNTYLQQMEELCSFLYQYVGSIRLTGHYRGIQTIYIGDNIFNLQGSRPDIEGGGAYSHEGFLEFFRDISPKSDDPIYTPGHDLYQLDNPSIDSQSQRFWPKLVSRVTIDNGEIKFTEFEDKDFYEAWLILIQNDLIRGGELFEIYRDKVINKDTNKPLRFINDPDKDFELIKVVRDILVNKLGHPMYFFLVSGITALRYDDQIHIEYITHPMGIEDSSILTFGKIIRRFGIKPRSSMHGDSIGYQSAINLEMRQTILFNGLISGFSQNIQGRILKTYTQRIDDNGGVLSRMFSKLNFNKFSSNHYMVMVTLFKNEFFNKFSTPKKLSTLTTLGTKKVSVFVKSYVKTFVDTFFDSHFFSALTTFNFPEFNIQNRLVWKKRTEENLNSIIDIYIDDPRSNYMEDGITSDILSEFRNALAEFRNAKIMIRSGGGTGRLSAFASNPLINQGLVIEIPYNKLKNFLDRDISYALNFYADSHGDRLPRTNLHKNGELNRLGYFNDFAMYMTDELKTKFKNAYNLLEEVLMRAKDKNGDWFGGNTHTNDELKVKFVIQNGGGIRSTNYLDKNAKSLGFTGTGFTFKPSNPNEFKSSIVNILFYLFSVRDSVAIISAGHRNFLSLNIHRFLFNEDFSNTAYSDPLNLNLLWGRQHSDNLYDHLLFEEYKQYADRFEGIFGFSDIALFTSFNNMNFDSRAADNGKLMLWYIWNFHIKPLFKRALPKGTIIKIYDLLISMDFNLEMDLSRYRVRL